MKKYFFSIAVVIILLLMTGCWDQDLLKNARLIYGAGFDLAPNGKLLSTFVIRDMAGSEQQSPKNDIIYTDSNTILEGRDKIDDKISRFLRGYRNRIILIGEEQAKQDIYPILDNIYRDPKSALNARIGVVQGKASDLLSLKKVGNVLIAEEIDELIKSKELTTNVPKVTIETIYPVIMDPGEDFVLPYLMKNGKRVDVSQIAMFHKRQFTGILSTDESIMYLLLNDDKGKVARFTRKISKGHQNGYDFLTFNVNKSKRNMKILTQSGEQITVMLDLKWKVSIVEYPKSHLDDKDVVAQLNQFLSKEMNLLINETIKKMQDARCDGLGIGRKLRAYHPDIWKQQKEDWGSNYQKVHFVPKIQVEITKKGIIN
ncbi:Ger(x)C family spore germination protein [Paenibacillus aceris]|uniref:Ger(X)C family germination protein n=1 Tax=Paenibacillus aceris TaxID=869555 RepID=A0ABS4HXM2_9BACL|nr:Ger(x)C family spore germination protein [Paenibacillus aceris]MBP1963086.1 Ger(x)C family germination protein [Paenibacillus aceris]NHW38793.1 Ger(x)C family spore germination protein [Paenibacillus aceris]